MNKSQNFETTQVFPNPQAPAGAVPLNIPAPIAAVQPTPKRLGFWSVSSGVFFCLALLVIPATIVFFMAGFSNFAKTNDLAMGYLLQRSLFFLAPVIVPFITMLLSLAGTIAGVVALACKQKLATLWFVLNSLGLSVSGLFIAALFITVNSQ